MPEELVLEMDELIGLDSKRIKSLDAVSVNSTENTRLFFARPSVNDTDCASFLSRQTGYQPTFTYPFFGQEELWKGCSKASLTICFDPQTFFAHVSFTVDEDGEEFRSSILEKLTEKLAKDGWTEDWSKFVEICSTDSSRPLDYGKSDLDKSESNGYSIISTDFSNSEFKKVHERFQILLLFFIEAASYIDDEDPKWKCYMMFKNLDDNKHALVGYTTLYPFLFYPDKIRMRLSQFLILPAFHRLGLGSKLYQHVYQQIMTNPEIMELTVEDPSEEFSVFRLTNDYATFTSFSEPPKRNDLKFSEIEYELVTQLDSFKKIAGNETDHDFRIKIKKSLWRRNKDTMPEEPEAMKEYLEELYEERISLFKKVLKISE